MPVLLIVLLAVVAEITVLVTVGGLIGVLPTIGLLVAGTLIGSALLRREGRRALTALQEAVFARRVPDREVVDGMLVTAAGVLVVVPGFISDVLAILLLLPPVRALVRNRLLRRAGMARRPAVIVVDSEVVRPSSPIVIPGQVVRED
ncbi:FxsA family protein [Actinokineospora enzanensis]|uniref:FxsA family protein n=1 Tax=Actinokineospora enzanensis TaxID=155975 RepID=UPI000372ADBB|nr:FxsA family protein [Actinokineospora enzanensis]